jgi:hypothetical protein
MRPAAIILGLVGPALITVGGFCVVAFWNQYLTALGTRPEPQVIRLRDLSHLGYSDNRHVKVTGCALGRNYVAFRRNGLWAGVGIPLVPADGDPGGAVPGGQGRWVVLWSDRPRSASDVKLLLRESSVQGVLRDPSWVPLSVRLELQRQYPGLDWSNCVVLDEGRVPMRETTASGFLAASAATTVLGGLVFLPWCLFCLRPWLKGYLARQRLLTAAAQARRHTAGRGRVSQSREVSDSGGQAGGEAVRPAPDDSIAED